MSPSLPVVLFLLPTRSPLSPFLSRAVLAATFRSDSVSLLLVYEGNAVHPRPRKRRRGFLPNSRAPSKEKTEPPLFDSTPTTYHVCVQPGTPTALPLRALPILRQIV